MKGFLLISNQDRYFHAMLLDKEFGTVENFTMGSSFAFTARKGNDPDTPTFNEAMSGPHREQFIKAMYKEIKTLEKLKTWNVIQKSDVPTDQKVIPSTWAFKIKRYPDGRLRKFKARFCVRGDRQEEGVDYFESYAPVVSWATVRMLMRIAIKEG